MFARGGAGGRGRGVSTLIYDGLNLGLVALVCVVSMCGLVCVLLSWFTILLAIMRHVASILG